MTLADQARAVAFGLCTQTGLRPPVSVEATTLDLGGRVLEADVYRPRWQAPTSTVLFVHGMTARGHRDQRVVELCQMLPVFGCAVVAPHFKDIAAFSTDLTCAADVEASALALLRRPDLAPSGRLGIFSASFSSLYCIIAALKPSLRGHVGSLCLVGGIYTLEAMRAVFFDPATDGFVRQVFLLNFLHLAMGPRPGLDAAFRAALEDLGLARSPPLLPSVLDALSPEDREDYRRLLADPDFLAASADNIVRYLDEGLQRELGGLGALGASVVLVHGAEDPLLHPADSRRMAALLAAAGVPHTLEVTPLVAHGERLHIGPALLPAAGRLLGAFARFFHDVRRGPR